jgi:chaperone modulatory protein CbpM
MIALEALLRTVRVDEAELRYWIESGWVLPEGTPGQWVFHEVDVARVRLIAEIRHDLAIDDGAVPVVLSLLDQLYGLRRELQALCGAVAAQPSSVRDAIAAAISDRERKRQ